jgi:acetyl esterase/lipase
MAALLTALALTSCSSGNGTPAPGSYGVSETAGITYTSLLGAPVLLDAFVPTPGPAGNPPSRRPAIILVHGGAWIGGGRVLVDPLAQKAASEGFSTFSVDYTLASATQVGYPLQVEEVLAAVAWVRAHAASYGVDGGRISLLGTSAGATLAVDAALEAPTVDPAGAVQAVAGWSGVYRFLPDGSGVGLTGAVALGQQELLGCRGPAPTAACAENAAGASAAGHVLDGAPPTLLATSDHYGVGCEIIDPAQTRALGAALEEARVATTVHVNHECAHASGYADVELQPTLDWFRAELAGQAGSG